MTADLFYTDHLTADEKERLYWQAGLTEIAKIYEEVADGALAFADLEKEMEAMVDPGTYEALECNYKEAVAKLEAATEKLDALYNMVSDEKRLNREAIKEAIAAVDLEPIESPVKRRKRA